MLETREKKLERKPRKEIEVLTPFCGRVRDWVLVSVELIVAQLNQLHNHQFIRKISDIASVYISWTSRSRFNADNLLLRRPYRQWNQPWVEDIFTKGLWNKKEWVSFSRLSMSLKWRKYIYKVAKNTPKGVSHYINSPHDVYKPRTLRI